MFSNMKVALRLSILAGTLLVLMAIIGTLGIQGMHESHLGMRTVYKDRVIPLKDLKLIADMYAVNIVDVAHKVRNQGLGWQEGAASISSAEQIIHERWSAYLNTELVAAEQKLVDELKPLLVAADSAVVELQQIFAAQDAARLDDFVLHKLYPSIEPVSERFTALVDVQLSVAEQAYQTSSASYARTHLFNIGLILVSVVASLILGLLISRSLIKQLGGEPNYTSDVINRIAQGDLSVQVSTSPQDQSSILFAIRQMVIRLSEIIGDVRATADSLSSASEELSATAQSLTRQLPSKLPVLKRQAPPWKKLQLLSDKTATTPKLLILLPAAARKRPNKAAMQLEKQWTLCVKSHKKSVLLTTLLIKQICWH